MPVYAVYAELPDSILQYGNAPSGIINSELSAPTIDAELSTPLIVATLIPPELEGDTEL